MKTTTFQHHASLLAFAAAALLLQGCGTASKVADDGQPANVVFPQREKAWFKEGTFPNLENLRAVGSGATKDQLYGLLGRPHFSEGLFGVREWDYIFHFRKPEGVITCQFKTMFDKNYAAQSFHWMPAECEQMLVAARPAPVARAAPTAAPRKTTLQADGLFRFDGSSVADLLPQGRSEIEALANRIQSGFKSVASVVVTGHTDRLGTDAYNDTLSFARANAVRALLVQQGIDAAAIRAHGMGKRQPVTECPGTQKNEALIACLQPNRRVEIEVRGAMRDSNG
jgi:outer membrane protein OmpA-like peptidoglycan-associated protein